MSSLVAIGWLVLVFAGGVALGGLFFGGLWLTVRCVPKTAAGPLLVILSFLLRTAAVVWGIYYLTKAKWQAVLACLAGFLLARAVILRKVFRSQSVEPPVQKVVKQ